MSKETLTQADLDQFTGGDEWTRHSLNRNILYTEGVRYLAETAGAYWLLDIIASVQHLAKVRAEEFQVWTLTLNKTGNGAVVKCDDGNGNVVYTQRIPFTDFPLPSVKLYFTNTVILLPSEN